MEAILNICSIIYEFPGTWGLQLCVKSPTLRGFTTIIAVTIEPGLRVIPQICLHLTLSTCSCWDTLRRHHGGSHDSRLGARAREDSSWTRILSSFLSTSRESIESWRPEWTAQSACQTRRCRTSRSSASAVRRKDGNELLQYLHAMVLHELQPTAVSR